MVQEYQRDARLRGFLRQLDLTALRVLGPRRFLADFGWRDSVRIRPEEHGGFLFVPETSQLLELVDEQYQRLSTALAAGTPVAMAGTGDPDDRSTAEDLYLTGALARTSPNGRR
jgi:hypothetical protein